MPFIRISGLINAFVVENARQQRELEQHADVSSVLSSDGGLLHRVLASRFTRDMGFSDGELPALPSSSDEPKPDYAADVLPIHSGDVYQMATYVAGRGTRDDIEVIAQRWLARRFTPRHEATPAVAEAARLIGGWHRRGPLAALGSIWGNELNRAKALLGQTVPAHLHIAYEPAKLLAHIVKCLERMRQMAGDPALTECLSPEMVVAGCLAPAGFVLRICKADVEVSFSTRPLPANTLLILPLRRLGASADASAFGSDDASLSPAVRLMQRLLTRVWIASREIHQPAAKSLSAVMSRVAMQPTSAKAADQSAFTRNGVTQSHRVVLPPPDAVFEPAARLAHVVADATLQSASSELSNLTHTLPFGNDVAAQRTRASERRSPHA